MIKIPETLQLSRKLFEQRRIAIHELMIAMLIDNHCRASHMPFGASENKETLAELARLVRTTESDLKDLINQLVESGFLIAVGSEDPKWEAYYDLSPDFMVNRKDNPYELN